MILQKILIVEDEEALRIATQGQLKKAGFQVSVAGNVAVALEVLRRESHDLVISDLNLPGASGMELLRQVRNDYPETTVVMVTAYATVKTAVEAIKFGAYDYLTKPVDSCELQALVHRALERRRLIDEVLSLRSSIDQKFGFANILGQSRAMLQVLDSAGRAAQSDATVLVLGETGTGKEVLAKAIHFNSVRNKRPFVIINCGSIPSELLESELFGHVRGAFTGALTHKKGKIEIADGGTVFLDEIGDMPLDLQVRILRLIQEREIEKVGASTPIPVNIRIVAATHRNLESLVEAGNFREDLYYRLAVIPIELPPLRARAEDIPELVEHFFELCKRKASREKLTLPPSLLPYFSRYSWPGNIRQLQNCIERLIVLCHSNEVTVSDLPEFLRIPASSDDQSATGVHSTLYAAECNLIVEALRRFDWNQTRAALDLGVSRKVLMSRIARYRIPIGRDRTKIPCDGSPGRKL
jgi:two-component system NtrC family response regulator